MAKTKKTTSKNGGAKKKQQSKGTGTRKRLTANTQPSETVQTTEQAPPPKKPRLSESDSDSDSVSNCDTPEGQPTTAGNSPTSTITATNDSFSSPGETLTVSGFQNAMHPHHDTQGTPKIVTPTSTMLSLVEITANTIDYKSVLKSSVLALLWPLLKFGCKLDTTKQGKKLASVDLRNRMGWSEQNFWNRWLSKNGIKSEVALILKNQRSYVTQQFKSDYYGEFGNMKRCFPSPWFAQLLYLFFPPRAPVGHGALT